MSNLLNCQAISKSFTSRSLFSNLSLSIAEGDHIAIIGANGSGKSTLLKILAGIEDVDEGELSRRKHLRIAYIPQQDQFSDSLSILEAAISFIDSTGIGQGDLETDAKIALSNAGFRDLDVKVGNLSGGWRKRLSIASGLALDPDILLLDEPTNHLDIGGVMWLEQTLKSLRSAWVSISHDRYFLENTAKKVAELNPIYKHGVLVAEGRYSDFIEKRNEYRAEQASYAQSLANKVRREVEWLRRGPKARTTKSKSRVDEAQALISELATVRSRQTTSTTGIDFTSSERKTKKLITAKSIAKQFDSGPLVSDFDFVLTSKMRVGLLGANGSGKSTLLKMLGKELEPDAGSVEHAYDLACVYFEQSRRSLDQSLTLRRALCDAGDSVIFGDRSVHIVSWAKKFQFRPEQLETQVSKLSGGEQARVIIAELMRQKADVLLLDEPTNDLDIETLEVLEDSLEDFAGALVLVSHDRYMLSRLCNIFIGLDGRGRTRIYADIEQWQNDQKENIPKNATKTAKKTRAPSVNKKKKLSYKDQRELDGMEEAILAAESEVETIQARLDDPATASDATVLQAASTELATAQEKVERMYARWAELEAMTGPP